MKKSEILPIIRCCDYGYYSCNYWTNRLSNLDRHQRTMHESHTENDITCCRFSFQNKAEYKIHRLAAHVNGYKCPDCVKVFSRPALLYRHSSTHTGIRDFHCHLCKYESSHWSNLQRHLFNIHGIPKSQIPKYIKPKSTQTRPSSYNKFRPCSGRVPKKCQQRPVLSHSIDSILNLGEKKKKNMAMAPIWGDNEVSSTSTATFSGYCQSPTPSPNANYMYYPTATIVPTMMEMEPQFQYSRGFGEIAVPVPMTQPGRMYSNSNTAYDFNSNSEWNNQMDVREENPGIPIPFPTTATATQSNPDETDDTFSNYVPKKWRVAKGRFS